MTTFWIDAVDELVPVLKSRQAELGWVIEEVGPSPLAVGMSRLRVFSEVAPAEVDGKVCDPIISSSGRAGAIAVQSWGVRDYRA